MTTSARKVLVIQRGQETDGYWLASGENDEACGAIESSNLSSLEEILARRQPDLIVLDLEIPIRHGVELLRTVRTACPEAEVMTRIDSRSLEPKFFSVRSSPSGLSLEPLGNEELGELPATVRAWKLAV